MVMAVGSGKHVRRIHVDLWLFAVGGWMRGGRVAGPGGGGRRCPSGSVTCPVVSGAGRGGGGTRSGRAGRRHGGAGTVRAGAGAGVAVAGGADGVRRGRAPPGSASGLRGGRDVRVPLVRARGLQGARREREALAAPGLLPAPRLPARPGAAGEVSGVRREAGGGAVVGARQRLHAVVRGAGGGRWRGRCRCGRWPAWWASTIRGCGGF